MDGSGSVAGLGLGLGVRGACTCAMIATWQQDGPDDAGWAGGRDAALQGRVEREAQTQAQRAADCNDIGRQRALGLVCQR